MEQDGDEDDDPFSYKVTRINRRTGEVTEVTEWDELMVAFGDKLSDAPGPEPEELITYEEPVKGPVYLPNGFHKVSIHDARRDEWVTVPNWCLFTKDGNLLIRDPKNIMSSLIPVQQAKDYFGKSRKWLYDNFFGTIAWVWIGGNSYVDARVAERMGRPPGRWPED